MYNKDGLLFITGGCNIINKIIDVTDVLYISVISNVIGTHLDLFWNQLFLMM